MHQVLEIRCTFIQGIKRSHINCLSYTTKKLVIKVCEAVEQSQIENPSRNLNQSQGHDKEYDNTHDEMKDV